MALVGIYGLSRLLGLVREIGVAFHFGTSSTADSLAAAFVLASVAGIVVSEAAYASTLRWLATSERSYGDAFGATHRLSAAASLLFVAIAPLIAIALVPASDDAGEAALLVVLLTPSVAAAAYSGCANASLTRHGRIARLNAAQLCYSLGAIGGLLWLSAVDGGPVAIVVGWSAGTVAAAVIAHRSAKADERLDSCVGPHWRRFVTGGLPAAAAFGLIALQGLTDRFIAGRIDVGAIAALGYADRLFLLPIGFVMAAFAPAVLGDLVRRAPDGDGAARARAHLVLLTRMMIPTTIACVALSPVLIDLVYGNGAFDTRSTDQTVAAFDGLAAGIATISLSLVLLRVVQAALPLSRLTLIATLSVITNLVVSVPMAVAFGIFGVALGTSITAVATAGLELRLLAAAYGDNWARSVRMSCLVPAALTCFGVAGAAYIATETSAPTGIRLAVGSAATVLVLAMARPRS